MSGFTTTTTLAEMINKRPMSKRRRNVKKKRKRKRVARDKQTDLPKKYLSGLKGGKRSEKSKFDKSYV